MMMMTSGWQQLQAAQKKGEGAALALIVVTRHTFDCEIDDITFHIPLPPPLPYLVGLGRRGETGSQCWGFLKALFA